jgi:streptogramin lyase
VRWVKANVHLKGLLAGRTVTVSSAARWEGDEGEHRLLAWRLTLRLSTPLSAARAVLPGTYLAPGPGDYLLRPSPPVTITRARTLEAFVDLSLDAVVRVTAPPGTVSGLVAGAGAIPITRFAVPMDNLAAGPDGNIWGVRLGAAADDSNCAPGLLRANAPPQIIRLTPGGVVTGFTIPTGCWADDLTRGADGNLWFTEREKKRIGRITPDGTITEFPILDYPGGGPSAMAAGPDGNVWFVQPGSHCIDYCDRPPPGARIGRITPDGTITEFPVASGMEASEIAAAPDGHLWFTGPKRAIGRINLSGTISQLPLPASTGYLGSPTAGPDGNMWFTHGRANKIARITPQGAITEFAVPGPERDLGALSVGPDGNLWFGFRSVRQIGRITMRGEITLFRTPSPVRGKPVGLTVGSSADVWFAYGPGVHNGQGVARISLVSPTPPAAAK